MHTSNPYSICIPKNMSLRFAILGLLAEEPLHGYEVKSRFERMLGGTWEVNIGQVYTTLQRLERDGLIEASGGRGDRNKLAYRSTASGRDAFVEWLGDPDDEPQQLRESIYLKLLLALRQRNGVALALLGSQHRLYLQRLRDLAVLEEQAVRDGRDDLVLLFRGAALHTEADLRWVESCRDALAQRQED
jgi:DNA-binding PadR family transcriptional regulator